MTDTASTDRTPVTVGWHDQGILITYATPTGGTTLHLPVDDACPLARAIIDVAGGEIDVKLRCARVRWFGGDVLVSVLVNGRTLRSQVAGIDDWRRFSVPIAQAPTLAEAILTAVDDRDSLVRWDGDVMELPATDEVTYD